MDMMATDANSSLGETKVFVPLTAYSGEMNEGVNEGADGGKK